MDKKMIAKSPFRKAVAVIKFYSAVWDRTHDFGPNKEGNPTPTDALWGDRGEKARAFLKEFEFVIEEETLNDRIDEWHEGKTNKELQEHLGWTVEGYKRWLETSKPPGRK